MGKFWWASKGYGSNGSLSQGWMQKRAYVSFVQHMQCAELAERVELPQSFLVAPELPDSFWTAKSSLLLLWHGTACETNLLFFPSLGCEKGQEAIKTLLCETWLSIHNTDFPFGSLNLLARSLLNAFALCKSGKELESIADGAKWGWSCRLIWAHQNQRQCVCQFPSLGHRHSSKVLGG